MVTGRSHVSDEWDGICTPSDGFRVLAEKILLPAIKETTSDDTEIVERSLSFLLSRRAETYFALLDIDPEIVIKAILKENGLEIVNGNGAR